MPSPVPPDPVCGVPSVGDGPPPPSAEDRQIAAAVGLEPGDVKALFDAAEGAAWAHR